jgi:hypothetical protein
MHPVYLEWLNPPLKYFACIEVDCFILELRELALLLPLWVLLVTLMCQKKRFEKEDSLRRTLVGHALEIDGIDHYEPCIFPLVAGRSDLLGRNFFHGLLRGTGRIEWLEFVALKMQYFNKC